MQGENCLYKLPKGCQFQDTWHNLLVGVHSEELFDW